MTEDAVYKVLLLGDSMVGKTSILSQYTDKKFQEVHIFTVGLDYRVKDMELKNGKTVKLQIWDTAGQDRFKAITKNYYKSANGILLIYDITDRKSFENLGEWIKSIKNSVVNYENKYIVFLMGAKLDLVNDEKMEREVTEEEAKQLCKDFDLVWGGECSSKKFTDEQYKEIFKGFIKKLYEKVGYNKVVRQTVTTLESSTKVKKKGNCGCIIF